MRGASLGIGFGRNHPPNSRASASSAASGYDVPARRPRRAPRRPAARARMAVREGLPVQVSSPGSRVAHFHPDGG